MVSRIHGGIHAPLHARIYGSDTTIRSLRSSHRLATYLYRCSDWGCHYCDWGHRSIFWTFLEYSQLEKEH